jgi:Mrp family chromosome partitioning ATPase
LDLDDPRIAALLDTPATDGLARALTSGFDPDPLVGLGPVPGLSVLPAGKVRGLPNEHLASPQMRTLLGTLKATHDVVILSGPPILESVVGEILGPMVDAVVLVIDAGRVSRADLAASGRVLSRSRSRILGAVIVHLAPRAVTAITRLDRCPRPNGHAPA